MCLQKFGASTVTQTVLKIYRSEAVGCVIFGRFSNVDNFRPEVCSHVISGVVVDTTGVKVCVKFGDSTSNRSRDIPMPDFVTNDDDAGRRIL